MSANATASHPTAVNVGVPPSSLYIGDLHPDVTEAMLFEKFSATGTVLSIRVCRDAVSRASLGYAYVNFQQHADAERALKTMNFDQLLNKPIRIMWSQRDPSIRRSGNGNTFIKNLSKHIDTKSMYDTFSMFGNILSCKVACDLEGSSKGYGFIHFETEESATKAIEKVNGMLLEGKAVFVGKFVPRAARLRELGESGHRFNNLYVKNFSDHLDTDKLNELFAKFGTITSAIVMLDDEKKSRGFGFVCFEKPEDAEKAVAEMNGYALPETELKLTVCRAQKKAERLAVLKRKYELFRMERMQKFQGVNLYVKNLDDNVNDETLKRNFEIFGAITSVKLMRDENGCSKGFGFVCFEKPDDATKAVVEMNNKMFGSKPLYVALAQRKEDRKAQLASQYMQRLASMRMQNPAGVHGNVYTPASSGYFLPTAMQGQRPGGYMPAQPILSGTQIRNSSLRWGNVSSGYNPMQSSYGMQPSMNYRFARGQVGQMPRQNRMSQAQQYGRGIPGGQYNAYSGQGTTHRHLHQSQNPSYTNVRNEDSLAAPKYMHEDEKRRIKEKLKERIPQLCGGNPDDVNKLLDMFLEHDMSTLEGMLADNQSDALRNKVNEALAVIHSSSTKKDSA